MDETLLQRYRRDPFAVIQAIELAARRERARVITQFLAKAATALFGTRRGRSAAEKRPWQPPGARTET